MTVTNKDILAGPARNTDPRGILWVKVSEYADDLKLSDIAAKFSMTVEELCKLTFGTESVNEAEAFLADEWGCSDAVLDDTLVLWVFKYDQDGNEIKDVEDVKICGTHYEPPEPKPPQALPSGAIQGLGASPVQNTVDIKFKNGDILLSHHPGDEFISNMSLAWPTHAGIVTNGDLDNATDAMPGKWRSETGWQDHGRLVIDNLPVLIGNHAFFDEGLTPSGGLVYRYTGGGTQANENKRVQRINQKRKKGFLGLFRKKEKAKVVETDANREMLARQVAEAAARWAKLQAGKNYKFSLRSNIVGVEGPTNKLRRDEHGALTAPDKRFGMKKCSVCGFKKDSALCVKLRDFVHMKNCGVTPQNGKRMCWNCGERVNPGEHDCDMSVDQCACGYNEGSWGCRILHHKMEQMTDQAEPGEGWFASRNILQMLIPGVADNFLCMTCGEVADSPECCAGDSTVLVDESGEERPYYFKYDGDVGRQSPAHSIYCSEFVWRAYRFGGGVTLVEPKEFLYFYKHPNRAVTWMLWHGNVSDQQRGDVIRKTEKWNWLPNTVLRKILMQWHFKKEYAGYILAPVQLAQSKFVKKIHRVPAKEGKEQITVWSVHKKNINPSDVAKALIRNTSELRKLRHSKAMRDQMGDTNPSDDTEYEKWLSDFSSKTDRFDEWLSEHAVEQKYTADSLDKPAG